MSKHHSADVAIGSARPAQVFQHRPFPSTADSGTLAAASPRWCVGELRSVVGLFTVQAWRRHWRPDDVWKTRLNLSEIVTTRHASAAAGVVVLCAAVFLLDEELGREFCCSFCLSARFCYFAPRDHSVFALMSRFRLETTLSL